jgi:hypothetical protein
MFFVGIFGMNAKHEQAGYLSARCPVCGCEDPLHVIRRYNYIHFFFIPVIRFGTSYLATCPQCASVYAVPKDIGDEARRTGHAHADPAVLTLIENNRRKTCRRCGALLDDDDSFCRKCGEPV